MAASSTKMSHGVERRRRQVDGGAGSLFLSGSEAQEAEG
jgi:hypothetical protein